MTRFRVGDVLLPGGFVVSPSDVATFVQGNAFRASLDRLGVVPSSPIHTAISTVPDPLLVARALAKLKGADLVRGLDPKVSHVRNLRVLIPPVVGETVTGVATVRFRSVQERSAHVTVAVELSRRY